MNYEENVAELLTCAQKMDTRRSSPIFVEHMGTRLDITLHDQISLAFALHITYYKKSKTVGEKGYML